MRNITIQREQCKVAALGTYRVYIEDPSSSELVICNVPCRRVADLKNGQSATFPAGEQEARVFVIAGNSSRNYCVDMARIPAGAQDVVLTGKAKYDLFSGNAFRFDNNETEEVTALRKAARKKGAVAFLVPVVLAFAVAFAAAFLLFRAR